MKRLEEDAEGIDPWDFFRRLQFSFMNMNQRGTIQVTDCSTSFIAFGTRICKTAPTGFAMSVCLSVSPLMRTKYDVMVGTWCARSATRTTEHILPRRP